MHWELGIEEDGGTRSIESFDQLKDALKALEGINDSTAFIDLWDDERPLNQTIKKSDIKKSIHVGKYNSLYALAEQGLQNSWMDLEVYDEVNDRSEKNKEFKELSNKNGTMPPSYFLYQKHSHYIVNNILKELGVDVDDD